MKPIQILIVDAIRDAAVRGSEIVRELMIYAGQETAAVEPVDLSKICQEILSYSKFQCRNTPCWKRISARIFRQFGLVPRAVCRR